MASERIVGMLIFPRLTQLDMTGPYEVLARLPNTKVHLVAHTLDPVKTDRGMMIVPTVTYADCPQLDVVMVPGGPGQQDLMEDAVVLDFLRRQAQRGEIRHLGLHRLAGAGRRRPAQGQTRDLPLGGDRASQAAGRYSGERARGGRRQYRDGGGRCVGHRFRSHARGHSRRAKMWRAKFSLRIEYDPAPPFNSGSPTTASAATLETVRGRLATLNQQRREVAQRVGKKLGVPQD